MLDLTMHRSTADRRELMLDGESTGYAMLRQLRWRGRRRRVHWVLMRPNGRLIVADRDDNYHSAARELRAAFELDNLAKVA